MKAMGGASCSLSGSNSPFSTLASPSEACRSLCYSSSITKVLVNGSALSFAPLQTKRLCLLKPRARRRENHMICMVLEERIAQLTCEAGVTSEEAEQEGSISSPSSSNMRLVDTVESSVNSQQSTARRKFMEKRMKRKAERYTYLFAAIASSVGVAFLAAGAVYYRFAWQVQGGEVPWAEMFGTFSLAVGASIGMEIWARWAHRALWHASLWSMHESHHRPRDGPFEFNDIFAIINAIPAIALLAYGFFHQGLVPGLCFGAGLGITVFGIAYMFVHDGLVHRRFPVGPIANVPYLQKVAAAHQLHHADKFSGVPYGLFLGTKELEEVGGLEDLEKALQMRKGLVEKLNATDG